MDCTIGEGGHTEEILKASEPRGLVIGLDRDPAAVERARSRLSAFGDRVHLYHENFIRLDRLLEREGIEKVDGILFDLGISSLQLEDAGRGFSFLKPGPLDMRMNPTEGRTAADLVNGLQEGHLTRLFREYGEERWASRISRAIVERRSQRPITTTTELVETILQAIPRRYQYQKTHPATRVFQALRIAVNEELSALQHAIGIAAHRLKPGGRLCIITFHSLEDRIVKHQFRQMAQDGLLKVITKRPVVPGVEEVSRNPRSRSAKLRVAERMG